MRQAQDSAKDPTEGPLSKFIADLIRRKARQLIGRAGFTQGDDEDIAQDLYLKLLKNWHSFDPSAGHPKAFAAAIVERQDANLLRDRTAEKRHHRRVCSLSVIVHEPGEGRVELAATIAEQEKDRRLGREGRSDQESSELRSDVTEIVARLPDDLRDLCERLMHDTVSQVARDLDLPRSTLRAKARKLRRRLENTDLRKYLE